MIYLPIIFFEHVVQFLCLFAPFTFVFCLISAIKKGILRYDGNEYLLNGFFAGLSLLVMLSGVVYLRL